MILESFLINLYQYLTGKDEWVNNNIIRKHTRKLEHLGDLSFPLDFSNWQSILNTNAVSKHNTIFDYLTLTKSDVSPNTLVNESKLWPLHISKCTVVENNINIYLERADTFTKVLNQVFCEKYQYGRCDLKITQNIYIRTDTGDTSLSDLRLSLMENVTNHLLKYSGCHVGEVHQSVEIILTCKSSSKGENIILCGAVLNNDGVKDHITNAVDLYNKRTIQMRLLAEHKYGVRVTSQAGWKEFFEKLGNAAVIIELLQNKPNHTVKVSLDDHTLTSNKGASFILYNCARLSVLLNEFDKKVSSNLYPQLPALESVDFSLLDQPEEWELLFIYILQFPEMIKSTVKDILSLQINPNYLVSMLSRMCSTFSVYYRRIKILTVPRDHLFPVLFARIYLLKALEQVLHNCLRLLDIEPVKQM